jgi:hypothetical protein
MNPDPQPLPADDQEVEDAFTDMADAQEFAETRKNKLQPKHIIIVFIVLATIPGIITLFLR